MTEKSYTSVVGKKFHRDGQVRNFPGNTVISHILENDDLYRETLWAQSVVMRLPFARKYSFLPPHSFHMTVFELLCDQVRDVDHWSSHLDLDIGIKETDSYFEKAAVPVLPPSAIHMRFDRIGVAGHSSICIVPANSNADESLRSYRDALSEATGARFPDHDEYRYHISLAYLLEDLLDEEKEKALETEADIGARLQQTLAEITIPSPSVTYFDHMHAFHKEKTSTARWA